MAYSLIILVYILFIQIFLVRNLAMYFAKVNYDSKENSKQNIKWLIIYFALYVLAFATRNIVRIYTFKFTVYFLLDVLVFFGMYTLYSDYVKHERRYWDISKKFNIIFSAFTAALFIAMSVLMIIFRHELIMTINKSQLVPALIAAGVFLALAVPLGVYFVMNIKKFKLANPKKTQDELMREEIRERLIVENEQKKFDERIQAGDESAVVEKQEWQVQQQASVASKTKKARFFTTAGKITLIGVFILLLGLNFLFSWLAEGRYYKIAGNSLADVSIELKAEGYTISDAIDDKYAYFTDELELVYSDGKSIQVQNGDINGKIYFGKFPTEREANEKEIKKLNGMLSEGAGVNMASQSNVYVAFGRRYLEKEVIYMCVVKNKTELADKDGFFCIVAENNSDAYYIMQAIKVAK